MHSHDEVKARSVVHILAPFMFLVVPACTSDDGAQCVEPSKSKFSPVNAELQVFGGKPPAELGVMREAWRNVVLLRPDRNDSLMDASCTGVHISPRIILTARHCLISNRMLIEGEFEEAALDQRTHETLDVGLLLLTEHSCGPRSNVGLPVASRKLEVGENVILIGFGLTEKGATGTLLAAQEDVTQVQETSVQTDGRGVSGACAGDSGGPLLTSEESPQVLGILSTGESSCVGIDEYVSAHAVRGWIEQVAQEWNVDAPR